MHVSARADRPGDRWHLHGSDEPSESAGGIQSACRRLGVRPMHVSPRARWPCAIGESKRFGQDGRRAIAEVVEDVKGTAHMRTNRVDGWLCGGWAGVGGRGCRGGKSGAAARCR